MKFEINRQDNCRLNSHSRNIIMNYEYPSLKLTEETKREVLEHSERYANCEPRIRMGLFYTAEEKERHIKDSLKQLLPGEKKGFVFVLKKSSKR